MKFLALVLLFAGVAQASASAIDDQVALYKNIKTITDVTYKGLPISVDAGILCQFLGYSVATDYYYNPIAQGKQYYSMSEAQLATSLSLKTSEDQYIQVLAHVTCMKP